MPAATVHAWNDTGWRHDGAHARLIAFDLDNTLAVSKQPMKPDMTVRIEALTELMPVAIVTGGGRELVISQVLDVLGPRADLSNLHVMPAGGSSYYRWREGAWRLEYERTLSARDRDAAILSLTRRARELGMWPEHPWGEPIEDRGSQITFSALGQLAPIEEKRRWDPDDTKKRLTFDKLVIDLDSFELIVDGKKIDSLVLEETNNETGTTYLVNDNGDTGEVVVLGSLIGIRLPEGEHTVSMKYTPPGFNMGIFTLILGIAVIVMFYIYDRKHNPVLKARRRAREIEKLGIPSDTPESQIPEMKKKVQIIKSKGAVDSQAAEAAKQKAEKARAEEEKIKNQNEELLNKGKAYAEKAEEESEKSQDEQASVKEEKPEKAVETKTDTSGQKPKNNGGNQNKNKGKNKKKK